MKFSRDLRQERKIRAREKAVKCEAMSFSWVPFYREVGARVLEYEKRQDELLALLREMTEQGLSPVLLNDRNSKDQLIALAEIDPFTFFASWNRGSKDANRRAICQFLKDQWGLNSEVPDDFDGIPTVNPQSSWFFAYLRTREPHDIKALWRLASAAVKNELDKITPEEWNQALRINQVGVAKLTMGLFWIEPEKFLPLDAHTVDYVRNVGVNIERADLDKTKLTIERYDEILGEIHNRLGNDNLKISLDAYGGEVDEISLDAYGGEVDEMPNFPLNQILYGPPGTGKTYGTIERAVEIIDGVAASSHAAAKDRFDELRANGQIEFVTFHQSFSYEEFIEGLRPILDEDGEGQARYQVRDGVLKTLALRATKNFVQTADPTRPTFDAVWNELLTRGAQRYRASFELARRLLRELSPELEGESANSWAFLVDMNAVFEGFCRAALEAKFGVAVREQVGVGTLFRAPNRVHQIADFVWTRDNQRWIGDAKWKLLGDKTPQVEENEVVKAGAISPADARQLSVYALLVQQQENLAEVPATALLYPTLSENAEPRTFRSWNGADLHLWPVRVRGVAALSEAIAVSS